MKKTMIQEEFEQYRIQDMPTIEIERQIETTQRIREHAQYTVERADEVMEILRHELGRRAFR